MWWIFEHKCNIFWLSGELPWQRGNYTKVALTKTTILCRNVSTFVLLWDTSLRRWRTPPFWGGPPPHTLNIFCFQIKSSLSFQGSLNVNVNLLSNLLIILVGGTQRIWLLGVHFPSIFLKLKLIKLKEKTYLNHLTRKCFYIVPQIKNGFRLFS